MGIMLVYDITNAKSFDNIAKWLRNIDEVIHCSYRLYSYLFVLMMFSSYLFFFLQHASEDVEKMILGNKCDMTDKRIVSKERGETIAREHGIRFLETSAKANINIDRAFLDLAEAILNKVNIVHACHHLTSLPLSLSLFLANCRTDTVRQTRQGEHLQAGIQINRLQVL